MKKKLCGLFLVSMLVMSQYLTAFATESQTASAVPGVSEGYEINAGGDDAVANYVESLSDISADTVTAIKKQVEQADQGNLEGIKSALPAAELSKLGLQEKDQLNPITKVFNLTGKPGKVTFTLSTAQTGKTVYALHLKTDGKWEVIPASLGADGKTATVTFGSLSPVILVAKTSAADTQTTSGGSNNSGGGSNGGGSGNNNSGGGSNNTSNTSDGGQTTVPAAAPSAAAFGMATSPKTGVASDWSMWMGAAVVLFGLSAMTFRKARA